ncbi:MAG: NAD-dependent epimerase/dehydratase family protein [Gammaproteobacteria bacterium]|nr:NAD-dependent epimerase/dehydratase family protein [Gammaproteobacteria bacterium]
MLTGATSIVGPYLVNMLRNTDYRVFAISRNAENHIEDGVAWLNLDLSKKNQFRQHFERIPVLIHLAPLPLLPERLSELADLEVKRIVAIGTTSRFTKAGSTSRLDREIVELQISAEQRLSYFCVNRNIALTILRPTMVYDGMHDKNVTLIAKFISRFGFFPIVGAGAGRRQPLHAFDLARACCDVLENETTYGRAYNIGGGQVLTYRDMVEKISIETNSKPRVIPIPLFIYRAVLSILSLLPKYRYLTAEAANRINKDLVFDNTEAIQDFGFKASPFSFREQRRF